MTNPLSYPTQTHISSPKKRIYPIIAKALQIIRFLII
jgi:hypothetical protein